MATLMRCILVTSPDHWKKGERGKKMEADLPLFFLPKVILNCTSRGHICALVWAGSVQGQHSPGTHCSSAWEEESRHLRKDSSRVRHLTY